MIYDKYGDYYRRNDKEKEKDLNDSDKKNHMFKKCHSLKNLKNRNTCDDI